jgi:hypothetical protein
MEKTNEPNEHEANENDENDYDLKEYETTTFEDYTVLEEKERERVLCPAFSLLDSKNHVSSFLDLKNDKTISEVHLSPEINTPENYLSPLFFVLFGAIVVGLCVKK